MVAAEGEEVLDECVTRFGVPPARVALAPNGRDPEVFHPPERTTHAPSRRSCSSSVR